MSDALVILYKTIENVQVHIKNNTLDSYCDKLFGECCIDSKHSEIANRIKNADWETFRRNCVALLLKTWSALDESTTKAVYYEYDLDNEWCGDFFFCKKYNPIEARDDDWACEYADCCSAPAIPVIPELCLDFEASREELLLVCYGVAMIGKQMLLIASELLKENPKFPRLCFAFHDQDPITRVFGD